MRILYFIVIYMKCPYCKEDVKTWSIRCKHCQADLSTDEAKKMIKEINRMSPITKIWLWFITLVVISVLFSWYTPQPIQTSSEQYDSVLQDLETSLKPKEWQYKTVNDDMTWKPIYFAQIEANDLLYFSFPYNWWVTAKLVLRHKDTGENDVMLSVTEWQFYWNRNNNVVKVRFDDGDVMNFKYNEPADSSSDLIFIANTEWFLQKLRKAKQLKISATFFNQWEQTMIFNVAWVQF